MTMKSEHEFLRSLGRLLEDRIGLGSCCFRSSTLKTFEYFYVAAAGRLRAKKLGELAGKAWRYVVFPSLQLGP